MYAYHESIQPLFGTIIILEFLTIFKRLIDQIAYLRYFHKYLYKERIVCECWYADCVRQIHGRCVRWNAHLMWQMCFPATLAAVADIIITSIAEVLGKTAV